MELTLVLGSNLGNRRNNIELALEKLDSAFGARVAQSSMLQTKACCFNGPDFFNMLVKYDCIQTPEKILSICKSIEKQMGRKDSPEYGPDGGRIYHDRIIDIDILTYGNVVLDSPELTIPHPQIHTRPYILKLLSALK